MYICCYYCSFAQSCLTLCDHMDCRTPGSPVFHYLLEFAETHVHWMRHPTISSLSSPSPPAFSLAQHQRLFQWVSSSHLWFRWPEYWSFSFSISPSSEYSELVSFRIDRFDHLAVQRTIKTLLQYHSLKASIPQSSLILFTFILDKEMATHSSVLAWRIPGTGESGGLPSMGLHRVRHNWSNLAAAAAAFFMVQLSYPYMITGKITALTIRTIGCKVISLLFNTLSRFVSSLSQEAHIFWFPGCSHYPQWLWSPRK